MKTLNDFLRMKKTGEKIVMLTAYDYPSARLADGSGVENSALQQDSGAAVVNFRVGAAHDPGQGHWPLVVPNEQIFAGQGPILTVEGGQGHAVLGQGASVLPTKNSRSNG